MENFSAITSLVLFGLFVITCPAEGFVAGYRYIDLPEPRLHSATMKGQGNVSDQELKERQAMEEEMAHDGEIIAGDNKKIPSRPIYYFTRNDSKEFEILAGPGVTEDQNQDTNTDAEKRADEDPQSDDERKVKDGQLNYEQQNNENDMNVENTV